MSVLDRIRERGSEKRALRVDNAMLREQRRVLAENGALVQEHLDDAIAELVDDEAGWRRVNETDGGDWAHDRRRKAIARARLMALKNPLVRRQVRTQVAYVFGRGVEIQARDERANEILAEFLADQRNAAVFTSELALADRELDLQTDGELFAALFVARGGEFAVTVRTLACTEIEYVRCNPEDAQEPWYYLRHFIAEDEAGARVDRYLAYVDLRYAREETSIPSSIRYAGKVWEVERDVDGVPVPVMHVKVGHVGGMRRGLPEVLAMMDWAAAYKAWLEDWSSLARALARFAWRLSTTGNAAATAARIGSRLGTGLDESNPAPAAGSVFVQQPGTSLDPIRTQGAAPKADDGLLLRKMAAAGSTFPDTILAADPDMGNLATAKTLDRPTELTIEMRQKLWRSVLRDLAEFVLGAAIEARELDGVVDTRRGNLIITLNGEADPTVDVEFPPVLEQDVKELMEAAAIADGLKALPPRTLAGYVLTALGIADQDEILAALFPDENDPLGLVAQRERQAAMAALPAAGAEDDDDEAVAAEAELVAAAKDLRAELARIAESGDGGR